MRYRLPLASIATTYCLVFLFGLYLAQGKTIGLHFDWRVMLGMGALIALKSVISIVYLLLYMRDSRQHVPVAAWGGSGISDERSQEVFIQVEGLYSTKGTSAGKESGRWLCGARMRPSLYLELFIHILLVCVVMLGALRFFSVGGLKLEAVLGSGGQWVELDRYAIGDSFGGESRLNGVNIRITELSYAKPGSPSKIVLQAKMSDESITEHELEGGDVFKLNGIRFKYDSDIVIANLKMIHNKHDYIPLPATLVRKGRADEWYRGEVAFADRRAKGKLAFNPVGNVFQPDIQIEDDKFFKRDMVFAEVANENGFKVYVPTMFHGAKITNYSFNVIPFMKAALLLFALVLIIRVSLRPKFVESGMSENGERWIRTNDRKVLKAVRELQGQDRG